MLPTLGAFANNLAGNRIIMLPYFPYNDIGFWLIDLLESISQKVDAQKTEFDRTKFYLGRLCKRGHNWNGTGQSFRYHSTGDCVKCLNGRAKEYRQQNREQYLEQRRKNNKKNREQHLEYCRKHYQENREQHLENCRKYRQENREYYLEYLRKHYQENREQHLENCRKYRQENREQRIEYFRKHYQENREQYLENCKKYNQTEAGKQKQRRARIKRQLNKQNNHQVPYLTSVVYQKFDGHCAYCGAKPDKLTIDHFLPIFRGGTDTELNALPACKSCNSSKNAKDPKDWYFKQSFATKKRWREILKVLGKTEANYNQLTLL